MARNFLSFFRKNFNFNLIERFRLAAQLNQRTNHALDGLSNEDWLSRSLISLRTNNIWEIMSREYFRIFFTTTGIFEASLRDFLWRFYRWFMIHLSLSDKEFDRLSNCHNYQRRIAITTINRRQIKLVIVGKQFSTFINEWSCCHEMSYP